MALLMGCALGTLPLRRALIAWPCPTHLPIMRLIILVAIMLIISMMTMMMMIVTVMMVFYDEDQDHD